MVETKAVWGMKNLVFLTACITIWLFQQESTSWFGESLLLLFEEGAEVLETGGEEFDQQTITNQAGETIHTRNIIELDIMPGFLWISLDTCW